MALSLPNLVPPDPAFALQEAQVEPIQSACAGHPGDASFHRLGESEEGRPLYGVVLGEGPHTISLIAGNHADEPVGPETLRAFTRESLRRWDELHPLFERCRFVIVPHTNPDGEARNQSWIRAWPDVLPFLKHRVREEPGRDMEFGFPAMRRENELVARFLEAHAPYDLHMSLHGMSFSEGAQLLIERHWTFRTQALREAFSAAAQAAGLDLHDHNRKGEKGFFYIEPGFTTTPEGEAMRTFFRAKGDDEMAGRFHDSSMEFVQSLGGDPLCLVTELPLFLIEQDEASRPGYPSAYLALKDRLPEVQLHLERGERGPAQKLMTSFGVRPLPLEKAMRLQLTALEQGLQAVGVKVSG